MKKRTLFISLSSLAILALILILALRPSKPDYLTVQVDKGEVLQSVDATGSVESSQAIELNFKTVGQINQLKVKAGDQVKTGDILATLKAGAVKSHVQDARSALLEAQANLEKVMAGATMEDIKISELTVQQRQQDLANAQINLSNLEDSRETELKNLRQTLYLTLGNQLVNAEAALKTIDDTLTDTDAENTLSVLDSSLLPLAQASQQTSLAAVAQAKLSYQAVNADSSAEELLAVSQDIMRALTQVASCLDDVFQVLQKTVISASLSQTALDSLVTNVQVDQTTLSSAKTSVQTAQANLTNKQLYYQNQIDKARNSVKSAQDALNLAQAQLTLKKAGPQSYDIKAARARVARSQASLAKAIADLEDTIIRAPVDGTITEVNAEIGEQTSLAQPVIKMISNSKLEIKVNVPESDIAKIKIGQPVDITLDAFGDETVFGGTVTFIDPAETIIQDVVYYQVKVQFNELREDIKPGMTANVTIIVNKKDDVLRLPLRAVKRQNDQAIVRVLVAQQPQDRQVKLGLRGNDYVEILDGLQAGEQVITFIKDKK